MPTAWLFGMRRAGAWCTLGTRSPASSWCRWVAGQGSHGGDAGDLTTPVGPCWTAAGHNGLRCMQLLAGHALLCRPSHFGRSLPSHILPPAPSPPSQAGQGCSLLIHEATFEPRLESQARAKRHSTTAEALEIAQVGNCGNGAGMSPLDVWASWLLAAHASAQGGQCLPWNHAFARLHTWPARLPSHAAAAHGRLPLHPHALQPALPQVARGAAPGNRQPYSCPACCRR